MNGINKLLYETSDELLEPMLTKEDIKENLHLKNDGAFFKLLHEKDLKHIKIGKQYLVPVSEYKKWIKKLLA